MDKLRQKLAHRSSNGVLWMRPHLLSMPSPIQSYDDPFLPFGKAVINVTRNLVAGYLFDLAAYLALGAAGMVALERTIAYAGDDVVRILHGPFASADYVEAVGENTLNVDAVTISEAQAANAYTQASIGVFAPFSLGLTGSYSFSEYKLRFEDVDLDLFGDDVLYAGHGEDFADVLRATLEQRLR